MSLGSRVYQLSDGEWYECGTAYLDSIRRRLRELIVARPELDLPPWRSYETEAQDNERVQDQPGARLHAGALRGGGGAEEVQLSGGRLTVPPDFRPAKVLPAILSQGPGAGEMGAIPDVPRRGAD